MLFRSDLGDKYIESVDRKSAYETLKNKAVKLAEAQKEAEKQETSSKKKTGGSSRTRQSAGEALMKSAARSIGSQVGRRLIRGILGSLFGGK